MQNPPKPSVPIVDDEPDNRAALRTILESPVECILVRTAADGHEALAALREGGIAPRLTDYRMPGTDGPELPRRVHRLTPTRPAITVSARTDPQGASASGKEAMG